MTFAFLDLITFMRSRVSAGAHSEQRPICEAHERGQASLRRHETRRYHDAEFTRHCRQQRFY